MTLVLRTVRSLAASVALAALAVSGTARANHFILPCDDECKSARWTLTGSLNVARDQHTATLLHDGRVLVAGGRPAGHNVGSVASAELYDPATGAWSLTGSMSVPRAGHTATLLSDGRVLVAGGASSPAQPDFGSTGSAEIYDPGTGTWRPTGPMKNAWRYWHAAVRLDDGSVLVAGGDTGVFGSVEIYNPDANIWTPAAELNVARWGHTMTLLDDGEVLLVGGSADEDAWEILSSTEIFDPRTGEWRRAADAPGRGLFQPAAVLPDGNVLLTGAYPYVIAVDAIGGDVVYGMAQRFDPDTETWNRTAGLLAPRLNHTATALASGHVLITGGVHLSGSLGQLQYLTLGSTERFDPDTEAWHGAANLNVARTGHTATRLGDGTVLVAGGSVVGPEPHQLVPLASAEIYGAAASARQTVAPQVAGRSRRTP